MPNRFASVLTCVAVMAATGAMAQPAPRLASPPDAKAPPTTVAPVTVEAAPTPKVIEQRASKFVESYIDIPDKELEQVGRWYDSVCVRVTGLVPGQAAFMKARIESVAQAVGLRAPYRGADCKPNVDIDFYAQDHPQQPIHPFYTHGRIATGADCMRSQLYVCKTTEVIGLNIVADAHAVEGKDLGLVADYMAMLTLAEPKSLDGCFSFQSVIDLYAKTACPDRDTPDGLTQSDAAFLTALYKGLLQYKKETEELEISERMADILIKANAPAKDRLATTKAKKPPG